MIPPVVPPLFGLRLSFPSPHAWCGAVPFAWPGGRPPFVGQGGRALPAGAWVGWLVGTAVGFGVGLGVGLGVGAGVWRGVATGVGVGVARGVGAGVRWGAEVGPPVALGWLGDGVRNGALVGPPGGTAGELLATAIDGLGTALGTAGLADATPLGGTLGDALSPDGVPPLGLEVAPWVPAGDGVGEATCAI
jgi:hypothetical protein